MFGQCVDNHLRLTASRPRSLDSECSEDVLWAVEGNSLVYIVPAFAASRAPR